MTISKSRIPNLLGVRTEFGKGIRILVITDAYYWAKEWTLVFLVALLPYQDKFERVSSLPVEKSRLFFGLSKVSETSLFTNPLD